jgi:hypothetical protein
MLLLAWGHLQRHPYQDFFKTLPISNEKFSGPQNTSHFSLPSAAKPGRFDITTLMTAFGLTH